MIRYEGGRNPPRADILDRIAKLGGVSVDWLLRGAWREPSRRAQVLRPLRALM